MDKFKEVFFFIKSVHNEMERRRNIILNKHGVTGTQSDIVEYLLENYDKEVYQKDLERLFNQSNPSMTGILNRLEKNGFIVRKISSKDSRYKQIVLTQKTYDLVIEMKKDLGTFNDNYNKMLSESEKEDLISLLKKLYLNMNK